MSKETERGHTWGEVEGGGRKDAAPKPAIAEFERLGGSKAKPQPSPVRGPLSCPALSFDGLGEAARLVGLLGLLLSPPFLFNSFASAISVRARVWKEAGMASECGIGSTLLH